MRCLPELYDNVRGFHQCQNDIWPKKDVLLSVWSCNLLWREVAHSFNAPFCAWHFITYQLLPSEKDSSSIVSALVSSCHLDIYLWACIAYGSLSQPFSLAPCRSRSFDGAVRHFHTAFGLPNGLAVVVVVTLLTIIYWVLSAYPW